MECPREEVLLLEFVLWMVSYWQADIPVRSLTFPPLGGLSFLPNNVLAEKNVGLDLTPLEDDVCKDGCFARDAVLAWRSGDKGVVLLDELFAGASVWTSRGGRSKISAWSSRVIISWTAVAVGLWRGSFVQHVTAKSQIPSVI